MERIKTITGVHADQAEIEKDFQTEQRTGREWLAERHIEGYETEIESLKNRVLTNIEVGLQSLGVENINVQELYNVPIFVLDQSHTKDKTRASYTSAVDAIILYTDSFVTDNVEHYLTHEYIHALSRNLRYQGLSSDSEIVTDISGSGVRRNIIRGYENEEGVLVAREKNYTLVGLNEAITEMIVKEITGQSFAYASQQMVLQALLELDPELKPILFNDYFKGSLGFMKVIAQKYGKGVYEVMRRISDDDNDLNKMITKYLRLPDLQVRDDLYDQIIAKSDS